MIYHTFIRLAFAYGNRDKNFTHLNRTQEGHVELDTPRLLEEGRPRGRKLHRFWSATYSSAQGLSSLYSLLLTTTLAYHCMG